MDNFNSSVPNQQPNYLADIPTSPPAFRTAADLLRHILQNPPAIALNVRGPNGEKDVFPSPLALNDLDDVIDQHLSGQIKPRNGRRKDGSTYPVTEHYSYGAYIVQRQPDDRCVVSCLCFDVDGADHAAGCSSEQVRQIVESIYLVAVGAKLNPVLEYSHGGNGFHIWIFFEIVIIAAFARALGDLVLNAAGNPPDVEVFPKQDFVMPGRLGNAIALPLNGKKVSANGGTIVNLDLSPRAIETIDFADPNAIETILGQWGRFKAALERIENANRIKADFNRLVYRNKPNPNDFSDVGLDAICRSLGEITDDREEEADVIKMNCPRHSSRSKKSLHVNVAERWWRCCACNDRGAGDIAEFTLAKWLLPDSSDDDVRQRLKEIREQAKGAAK